MSQMSVATTVARRAPRGESRTSLHVVRSTDRAGSAWFPVLCVTLLLAGLACVLGLNTWMAHDAFEVSELEAKSARLADTEAALTQDIDDKSSPQNLAKAADELGMVPSSSSAAFIDVENGRVLGVATVAEKDDAINVDAASTTSRSDGSGWSSNSKEKSSDAKEKQSGSKADEGSSEDSSGSASGASEKPREKTSEKASKD